MFGTTSSTKETEKKPGIFSRLFHSGKSDKSTAGGGSNSANSQASGVSDASVMGGDARFGVSEADTLIDLSERLSNSKKLGFGKNSESFDNVISAVRGFKRYLSQRFGENKDVNMLIYQENISNVKDVVSACKDYINSHDDPKSGRGKARKQMVMQIMNMALNDELKLSNGLMSFYTMSPEEQQGITLPELLRGARTVELHTEDFNNIRNSKANGGGASDVMKININDGNVSSVGEKEAPTHFFKYEDVIKTPNAKFNGSFVIDDILKRFPEIKGTKDEPIIRTFFLNQTRTLDIKKLPLDSLSETGKEVMKAINALMTGADNTYNEIITELGYAESGKNVNMSRRNVATSRVAELVGMGNLIAKSELATIKDDKNNSFTGITMERAKGTSSAGAVANKEKTSGKPNQNKEEGYQLRTGVTGGFQRDLCNLQLLDCICGQVDRHTNNYIVTQNEEGDMTGLQGIDNDAAFGLNEDNKFANVARSTRSVVNRETGLLTLPYIDDAAAKRIEALDGSALEYCLADLLTPEEIKAAISRLNKIKQAIKETRNKEPERFLKDESDWNDDTAQRMIDMQWASVAEVNSVMDKRQELRAKKVDEKQMNEMGLSPMEVALRTTNYQTYFGDLMAGADMIPGFAMNLGKGAAPKVKRHNKK